MNCMSRIGQRNAQQDERVVLFIKPKAGRTLDESMIARLKREIGNQLSKRHIPSKFIACPDIPVRSYISLWKLITNLDY